MLEARKLKKKYIVKEKEGKFFRKSREVEAVKEISLRVEQGKIVGLLGINGAGKTTTIKMLSTLLQPTSGEYIVDEMDALKKTHEVKKIINMVAGGERMIYWRLTAEENLWYFGQLYGIRDDILKVRIKELLFLVGLIGSEKVPVETFSKGMKQRLQIARGLINEPKYLFMDEPTLGLDIVIAKELREHIHHLARKKEKGILLTSHYLGEIEELCDYIYIIDKGGVVREGSKEEIIKENFIGYTYYLRMSEIYANLIQEIEIYFNNIDINITYDNLLDIYISCKKNISKEIFQLCVNNNFIIRELHEKLPTLEQTILSMIKEK